MPANLSIGSLTVRYLYVFNREHICIVFLCIRQTHGSIWLCHTIPIFGQHHVSMRTGTAFQLPGKTINIKSHQDVIIIAIIFIIIALSTFSGQNLITTKLFPIEWFFFCSVFSFFLVAMAKWMEAQALVCINSSTHNTSISIMAYNKITWCLVAMTTAPEATQTTIIDYSVSPDASIPQSSNIVLPFILAPCLIVPVGSSSTRNPCHLDNSHINTHHSRANVLQTLSQWAQKCHNYTALILRSVVMWLVVNS